MSSEKCEIFPRVNRWQTGDVTPRKSGGLTVKLLPQEEDFPAHPAHPDAARPQCCSWSVGKGRSLIGGGRALPLMYAGQAGGRGVAGLRLGLGTLAAGLPFTVTQPSDPRPQNWPLSSSRSRAVDQGAGSPLSWRATSNASCLGHPHVLQERLPQGQGGRRQELCIAQGEALGTKSCSLHEAQMLTAHLQSERVPTGSTCSHPPRPAPGPAHLTSQAQAGCVPEPNLLPTSTGGHRCAWLFTLQEPTLAPNCKPLRQDTEGPRATGQLQRHLLGAHSGPRQTPSTPLLQSR